MFEKLDKLRAELKKARKKQKDAEEKVHFLEEKLREAENTQILSDVGEVNFTPEQLNQFLQLVKEGYFPFPKKEEEIPLFLQEGNEDVEEEGEYDENVEK